ncbi:MAG: hypothetical protein EHM61_25665 [Acidobacteria bacterium]|nr:MAG: hypothetical protein EHM61_25665 [Acidobacteriota bacterium]
MERQQSRSTEWTSNWNGRFKTGGKIRSTPAYVDGVIYAGSEDGNLYALEASSGRLKWRYFTDGDLSSSPAVVGSTVLFTGGDGHFHCVDRATGRLKWLVATGPPAPLRVHRR